MERKPWRLWTWDMKVTDNEHIWEHINTGKLEESMHGKWVRLLPASWTTTITVYTLTDVKESFERYSVIFNSVKEAKTDQNIWKLLL